MIFKKKALRRRITYDETTTDYAVLEQAYNTDTTDVTGLDRGFIRNLHKCCGPALRHLNLSHSGMHHQNLPWLELQRSCPNVETLLLNGFGGASGWSTVPNAQGAAFAGDVPGWQNLKTLHVGAATRTVARGSLPAPRVDGVPACNRWGSTSDAWVQRDLTETVGAH